jgi:hypothetical protein
VLDDKGGTAGDGAPSIKRRDCNVPPFRPSQSPNQLTIRGADAPILALCRELLAAGLDPDTAAETYWRRVLRHG